jgi:hypothetical protein
MGVMRKIVPASSGNTPKPKPSKQAPPKIMPKKKMPPKEKWV